MPQEWFTPISARQALARVRPITEALCEVYRELEARAPGSVTSDQIVDPAYFERLRRLHTALGRLERMGVVIKDLRRGLVDFPARREGRDVLLCWRVGEPRLSWWHEFEEGFGGRRPVDDDGPWEEPDERVESSINSG